MGVSHFESGRWKDILRKKKVLHEKFPNKVTAGKVRKRKEKVVQRFVLQFLGIRGRRSWAVDTEEMGCVRGKTGSGRGRIATIGRKRHMTYCVIYWYVATYWGFLLISFPKLLRSQLRLWHILCNVQDGHCLCNSYCLMTAWQKRGNV